MSHIEWKVCRSHITRVAISIGFLVTLYFLGVTWNTYIEANAMFEQIQHSRQAGSSQHVDKE